MTILRYAAAVWCAMAGGIALSGLGYLLYLAVAFKLDAPVNLQAAGAAVAVGGIAFAIGLFVVIKPESDDV